MRKQRGLAIRFGGAYKGPPDRFSIEVKGLSTGNWCPQTTCPDDSPECVRATMRAQGSEWMLDKREWRVVPL